METGRRLVRELSDDPDGFVATATEPFDGQ
jgi:hypothetical protein